MGQEDPEDPEKPAEEETDPAEPEDAPGPGRFWKATLPGGEYNVVVDRITSISRHKYVLDGALLVDEVTVDCIGQALARFYFISPITDATSVAAATQLADRGRELLDKGAQRIAPDLQNMVVKKYPDTTHARTIEYRLLTEADLTALYSSVKTAWESGRGRQFSAK